MDNYILQTLISQGRLVTAAEIDPNNSYLQVGVYQPGNRKSKAANDAYPAFAIPLSEILSGGATWGGITGTLSSQTDLQNALNSKYDASNPAGYISGITSGDITTALGFTPYSDANPANYIDASALSPYITSVDAASTYYPLVGNPSGFLTSLSSGDITSALGFTPYDSANPAGYITSSALSSYLTTSSAASTYAPLSRQLTINGVTYDLTADRTWTIATPETSGTTMYSTSPAAGPGFNTVDSIYFGDSAGFNASGATLSNMWGKKAGYEATNAFRSNFIGHETGYQATNANNSTFIGYNAGRVATNANNSTFIGTESGLNAAASSRSTYIGTAAGKNSSGNYRLIIGDGAGELSDSTESIYMGSLAGKNSTTDNFSVSIGAYSSTNKTVSNTTVTIGYQSGNGATSISFSNCIGYRAGNLTTNSNNGNFIGIDAGRSAINSNDAIFIGNNAGVSANNAFQSVFIGKNAGKNSVNAGNVIALGNNAGLGNTLSNMTIISNDAIPSYPDRPTAQLNITGGSPGSTYLYYNQTNGAIEAIRFL